MVDRFLTEVVAAADDDAGRSAPVRVLLAADSDTARLVLAHRLGADERFTVVGQAGTPEDVLAEGVAALPDVVLVRLSAADRVWLDALGELTAWSPRTRLVAVSGIHADHLAEVVLTPAVAGDLAEGRPPAARVAAVRPDARAGAAPATGGALPAAPRSLIHEVMRQMGIPVRVRR